VLNAIILKEIRGHVLSFRFQAIFLLLLVIIPVTTLVLTNDYVRQQDDASRRQAEIQAYLSKYAHFNRLGGVIAPSQPPLPFLALVRGLSAEVNMDDFDNDPLPVMFPLIDLVFIVTILLSLAALVLSYDAVAGEREDGTLKLMLANGVTRARVILGKFFGGIVTLLIPFAVGLAIGTILLLLNPRVGWTGSDWGALGMIVAGAVVYIGLFFALGILFSSLHRSSASSIMTSLFAWVLIVLVIPNLSPYAASLLRPTPSRITVNRQISRLQDVERDDLGRKLEKERRAAVLKQYPVLESMARMSQAEVKAMVQKDAAFAQAYGVLNKEVDAAWREANAIQSDKAKVLSDDLDQRQKAQTKLSRILSMASPLADFSYLAADLSNTGLRNQQHFETLVTAWGQSYREYSGRKMNELRKLYPTMEVWNMATDVSDMPRFVYKEEALSGRILAGLWPLVVLVVLALALFTGGFVAFLRYDVR
jgi:ABC-type transport system involved in multi-copper enzyme maturation permease subunit